MYWHIYLCNIIKNYMFCPNIIQYMGYMCLTVTFEFRWLKWYIYNPSYYHHQLGSIHLSHCCHISPWLCVWHGGTTIFCHLLIYIYISGTLGLFSGFDVQFIDVKSTVFANDRIHHVPQVVFVCLQITPSHYHHYADLSEGIELIKCLSGICCRVCV